MTYTISDCQGSFFSCSRFMYHQWIHFACKTFFLLSLTACVPSFLHSCVQIWKQHQAVQSQSGRLPLPRPWRVWRGVRCWSDHPPPKLSLPQQWLRPGLGASVAGGYGRHARRVCVIQPSRSSRLSAHEEGAGAQTGQQLSHHRLGWHRWGHLCVEGRWLWWPQGCREGISFHSW